MNSDCFVQTRDIHQKNLTGRLFEGSGAGPHHGILVLHGSGGGGGYEQTYAQYLAEHGYTTFCVEYFGTADTPDALAHIPLSYFERAAKWLADQPTVESGHLGVVGFSQGGEAALLVGSHLDCIGAVIGYVPSGFTFPAPMWMDGVDEEVAAWTTDGEPVPYIPVDEFVETSERGLEETLQQTDSIEGPSAIESATQDQLTRATIEVERIDGPVLLISGKLDQVWPSSNLSAVAIDRLATVGHSWPYAHLSFPEAGHAIRVPYRFDETTNPETHHRFGGTNKANARASAEAYWATLDYLRQGLRERDGKPQFRM